MQLDIPVYTLKVQVKLPLFQLLSKVISKLVIVVFSMQQTQLSLRKGLTPEVQYIWSIYCKYKLTFALRFSSQFLHIIPHVLIWEYSIGPTC